MIGWPHCCPMSACDGGRLCRMRQDANWMAALMGEKQLQVLSSNTAIACARASSDTQPACSPLPPSPSASSPCPAPQPPT